MKPFRIVVGSFALVAALIGPIAPAAPAQAFPTLVIPTCAQMFSPAGWTLFPRGMVLTSDTVTTGAGNVRQTEIINTSPHRNCTWTDAKGRRSITVSVATIDIFEHREIRAWYLANHITPTGLGGPPPDFAWLPHAAPRLEAHYTANMFFIAIDDRSFGSLGGSMQEVYGTLVRLNPWIEAPRRGLGSPQRTERDAISCAADTRHFCVRDSGALGMRAVRRAARVRSHR